MPCGIDSGYPDPSLEPQESVNEQTPYELALEDRVVVIRCRGEWDRQTGIALFLELEPLIQPLEDGKPWATLADFSQWAPTDPDLIAMANDAKALLDGAGRVHGALLIESLESAKIMIERSVIQPETERIRYFQNEHAARQWLASLGYLGS